MLAVAVLRTLCRGVWSSARFRARPRPRLVGCLEAKCDQCPYLRCPRVTAVYSSWAAPLFPLGLASAFP
eukprot:4823281-Pyramimonas_sp.AAC.1